MLNFYPPLLNSASRWATTSHQLQELYDCPNTGAVTIRTSLLNGFKHEDDIHQHGFFPAEQGSVSSLNTLGYSPISLCEYIAIVQSIHHNDARLPRSKKPFIFSVAGSYNDIIKCRHCIDEHTSITKARCLMEINLSCPNIAGKSPPGYSKEELLNCLYALGNDKNSNNLESRELTEKVEVGIKIPPYTFQGQFDDLISALLMSTQLYQTCPISFITAVNTLGFCLCLDPSDQSTPVLNSANGTGIGGLAGASLHPLALGNVASLRQRLDSFEELKRIEIIGVGGVADGAGFRRMENVGAAAVGIGTALGSQGIRVFEKIIDQLE